MRKLPEVEDATALMTEAAEWSVVRWLKEKKRVRKTADKANSALDALNNEIKASWDDTLKAAYQQVTAPSNDPTKALNADPALIHLAKIIRRADDLARRARMDAEDTFDEAERQLSARLAREGCRKAIVSWELHEIANRKAEAALASAKQPGV
jgi:arginine utilization protein RocB